MVTRRNSRYRSWNGWHLSELIRNNIVQVEELRSIKNKFFELLQSNQEDSRLAVRQSLSYYRIFIRNKILTKSTRDIFLNSLQIQNKSVRSEAWNLISFLIQEHIKGEEIFKLKDYFFELLQSKNENVDNTLRFFIDDLIERKILNLDESIFFYDKALERNPRNTDALNRKGYVLAACGRKYESFSIIEKAFLSKTNDEYLQSTMAFILYNQGKLDDAKLYYDKTLKINSNLTEILTEKELTVFNKLRNNK
jgi:tetratricopeptide (TPR) repeat protein